MDASENQHERKQQPQAAERSERQRSATEGADLSKELDHLAEIAKNARKTFFVILVACAYCSLTIGTTEDVDLLGNASRLALPIIRVEVPVVWFYAVGPVLLLGAYFYLHLYLLDMWRGVARLFERVTERRSVEEYLYPWVLSTSLVRVYGPGHRDDDSPAEWLANWIPILLAWGIVPMTLLGFWIRYLMRHDWLVTSIHLFTLAISLVGGFFLHRRAVNILTSGQVGEPVRRSRVRRVINGFAATFGVAILLALVSFSAINSASQAHCDEITRAKGCGSIYTAGRVFAALGRPPHASLDNAEATGAALRGRDMRHAAASGATLTGADLSQSDLRWINLTQADLLGADLSEAELRYARLEGANFREARLIKTSFDRADMPTSEFAGAILDDASFQEAILLRANLDEAAGAQTNLSGADLRAATLKFAEMPAAKLGKSRLQGAQLEGANLSQAVLVEADLLRAKLQKVILSDADLTGARLDRADLSRAELFGGVFINASLVETQLIEAAATRANLQAVAARTANLRAADLRLTDLTRADLTSADLSLTLMQGSVLTEAKLVRTNLSEANLAQANLQGADLTLAKLAGANLSGADLTDAVGLTQAQLDRACGDRETLLPPGLVIVGCTEVSWVRTD